MSVRNYLSISPGSYPSGNRLRRYINRMLSDDMSYRRRRRRIICSARGGRNNKQVYNLIRSGGLMEFRSTVRELNNLSSILRNSNKYTFLEDMDEAEVRVPHHSRNLDEVDYPLVARRDYHSACSFLHYAEDLRGLSSISFTPQYFLKYIKPIREYRVHMFKGEVIKVQTRYPRDPTPHNIKHGSKFGWGLHIRQHIPISSRLKDMCVKSFEAMNLDFGAIDAILGEDRRFYLLEINTAPGLNDDSASKYAKHMVDWLNNNY